MTQSNVRIWANAVTEDRMCIMLEDVSRAEIQKLITGKRSKLRTKLQKIIDENIFEEPRRAGADLLGPPPKT